PLCSAASSVLLARPTSHPRTCSSSGCCLHENRRRDRSDCKHNYCVLVQTSDFSSFLPKPRRPLCSILAVSITASGAQPNPQPVARLPSCPDRRSHWSFSAKSPTLKRFYGPICPRYAEGPVWYQAGTKKRRPSGRLFSWLLLLALVLDHP